MSNAKIIWTRLIKHERRLIATFMLKGLLKWSLRSEFHER